LYLADKNYYEENARRPIRERSREEQGKVYRDYQSLVLKEICVPETPELLTNLMNRMRELNASMKFVLFEDVLPALQSVKQKKMTVGLLTNLQHEIKFDVS